VPPQRRGRVRLGEAPAVALSRPAPMRSLTAGALARGLKLRAGTTSAVKTGRIGVRGLRGGRRACTRRQTPARPAGMSESGAPRAFSAKPLGGVRICPVRHGRTRRSGWSLAHSLPNAVPTPARAPTRQTPREALGPARSRASVTGLAHYYRVTWMVRVCAPPSLLRLVPTSMLTLYVPAPRRRVTRAGNATV